MPAESLPTFDIDAIAKLIGIGIGTAIAVILAYKKAFKDAPEPARSNDVIIPTLSIATTKPIEEALGKIALSIGEIHHSLKEWRREDVYHREKLEDEEAAFRRGAAHERQRALDEAQGRPPRRRPLAE